MSKFDELVTKLREIFQIDRPELDFGVYRILNARADEINEYLTERLREQVEAALATGSAANMEAQQRELDETIKALTSAGVDPESAPKVKELRAAIAGAASGASDHENAVFSHLLAFFSRYYDKGDFISQRRYKGDTYAIPYAGEEVVLHWANKDQYYTKSGEAFSNYGFKLPDGRAVRFQLIAADTAKDNRKDNDKDRFFQLAEARTVTRIDNEGEPYEEEIVPIAEEDGDLVIRFEYKAFAKKGSQQAATVQAALASAAAESVLDNEAVKARWVDLTARAPTEAKPQRTVLEQHLSKYVAKNQADYFIHKDLGTFLRRELDFYIKNEVMNLDDVQDAKSFAAIEANLRMIQCLRQIARDLITFLASIEDFQKKLWLKKKFVVAAHYCVTLDRVPEPLYDRIAANPAQWAQWHDLGMRDSAAPGGAADLKAQPSLMVDTALFDAAFRADLLKAIPDLDASTDGLLVHGDNFQALTLLQERYREQVKCVYIDPPYNTGSDFLYKDSFRNSSWLGMLDNRIQASRGLVSREGVFYVHIDDKDEDNRTSHRLMNLLEDSFGRKNYLDNLIWVKNTTHNDAKAFSHNHEYILAFAIDREAAAAQHSMFRIAKPGFEQVQSLVRKQNQNFPPITEVREAIRSLYANQYRQFKKDCELQGLPWDEDTKRLDPWKGIKQYKFVDYRDTNFVWVNPSEAHKKNAKLYVYREDNPSWPNANTLTADHKNPEHPEYRFYKPEHPVTGRPCPAPARGWLWRKTPNPERPNTLSFNALVANHMIHFGEDENKVPQFKRFLERVDTDVVKSVITDFTDGEKEVSNLFGSRGNFPNPKPTTITKRLLNISLKNGDMLIDYFAGSGSTGHSILNSSRDGSKVLRYALVDVGQHFYDILKPRIQKVVFSADWRDGKPTAPETGISHAFKVLKIESYEDTLNNLTLKRDAGQQGLLERMGEGARDEYLMRYMLDVEARGSLLSVEDFAKPFDYELDIAVDSAGATQRTKVDLLETFNYLIGLTVKTIDIQLARGFATVEGTLPDGKRTLILWRDCEKLDYDGLTKLCDRLAINPGDTEYDVVYVNGDHNLPTKLQASEADGGGEKELNIRQIEPDFLSRMFDVADA